jgi:hypothetical protein
MLAPTTAPAATPPVTEQFFTYRIPEKQWDIHAHVLQDVYSYAPIEPRWLETLTSARDAYSNYGVVPPLDEHDPKSCILLLEVVSPCPCGLAGEHTATEWYSMRFVPSDGRPFGHEDFSLCKTSVGSLRDAMQTRLFGGNPDFAAQVISIARICASSRRCSKSGLEQHRSGAGKACFWIGNDVFFKLPSSHKFRFLTGLFRPELVASYASSNDTDEVFTPAHKTLRLASAHDVYLDRWGTPYRWPGYFLNLFELGYLLEELVLRKQLAGSIAADAKATNYKNFGAILLGTGPLLDSNMTHEELRSLVDNRVSDGPHMRIMDAAEWRTHIAHAVSLLRIIN